MTALNSTSRPSRKAILAALVAVQVLFGVNYIVSKVVVGVFPPLVWASIRIIISAAVLVFFAVLLKRPHPRPSWAFFGPLIVFAFLGCIINQAAFLVGLHYTTSTNSAILNTMIPVFTLLIVTLRGQEPVTPTRVLGFMSAFAGVLVLRNVEHFTFSDRTLIGDLLTILNCLSYALFLSYGKKFLEKYDALWTTSWLFIYGSIGLTVLAIPDWIHFKMPEMTSNLWAASAFAVIGATLLTYFLNFWALVHARSSQVALFIYMQPVVTSAIAWVWLSEPVTFRSILSSGLIFVGMVLALSTAIWRPSLR